MEKNLKIAKIIWLVDDKRKFSPISDAKFSFEARIGLQKCLNQTQGVKHKAPDSIIYRIENVHKIRELARFVQEVELDLTQLAPDEKALILCDCNLVRIRELFLDLKIIKDIDRKAIVNCWASRQFIHSDWEKWANSQNCGYFYAPFLILGEDGADKNAEIFYQHCNDIVEWVKKDNCQPTWQK